MIQAVYGLPAKRLGYMGLVWTERRNNTHTLPITRRLWVAFLQFSQFYNRFKRISVWSVVAIVIVVVVVIVV